MKKPLAALFALVVAFAMTTTVFAQETQPSLSDKPVVEKAAETPVATPAPVQSPANVVVEGVPTQPATVMPTTPGCGCGQTVVAPVVATPAAGCNTCDPCNRGRRVIVRRVRILRRRCCN